ncbi:MAG: DUF4238 domain-containing protein [Rhodocyclales bacterium]|nr:DUF4238 domain-containing protein [Rhodocyclales bacterium]
MTHYDHYVSQTYLTLFCGREGTLVPYYKDGHVIVGKPKWPKSICSEVDGDMNTYFDDARVLDTYLQPIETRWAGNVKALRERRLDARGKYELASYIAYLRACNPVAKRLGQGMIAAMMQPQADKVLREHLYDPPADSPPLDDATRAKLQREFEKGGIKTVVDRDYAHARGIASLTGVSDRLYCSHWLKLSNETDVPFITSDNPPVIYPHGDTDLTASIFVPLSPTDAVLISPNNDLPKPSKEDVQSYESAGDKYASVKREAAKRFNVLVVKSAERLVLCSTAEPWVEDLVSKYRTWRMEHVCDSLPHATGVVQIHRQRPVDKVAP